MSEANLSIFESIHAEKKLSFNHWRYRILHWFFNVDPKNVEEATEVYRIDSMFYKHYCPLFHLTNLILLFFPLVLAGKFIYRACSILNKIQITGRKLIPESEATVKTRSRKEDVERLIYWINENPDVTFEYIWGNIEKRTMVLTREEAENIFVKYITARKAKVENDAKRRERILFWVNFSRVFIKGFLYVGYAMLTLFLLWLTWNYGLSLIFAIWNINVLAFSLILLRFMLLVALVGCILLLIYKVIGKRLAGVACGVISDGLRWVGTTFSNAVEFIQEFFIEACPPIKIISDDEAIIEDGVK